MPSLQVSDLETSHQPWPKADFISLTERVAKMDVRLDTLPPDAALVTKMYLKEYDNQWVKKWQAMEEETGSRFDRLENRLASFEENVLRVELKIEHDMKQCLTVRFWPALCVCEMAKTREAEYGTSQELRRCVVRLDEVEQNSQEAMRLGFERVERDVTDITLVSPY